MLIRVVIAEDHVITRQGLRTLLESRVDARVAADTGDGLKVVPLVQEHAPDLLILDLGLPGLNGLDALRHLSREMPHTQVIILSMHEEDSYVIESIRLGARGYVLKGAAANELLDAVRSVVRGERYLSNALSPTLIDDALDLAANATADRYDTLTEREREVLHLTAQGYTSREVGDRLYISHRTVEKHRQNLMAKLNLSNLAEIVQFSLRRGLLPMHEALE